MKAKEILTTEIDSIKISSLPSRPTAPTAFGGLGLTSKEMREAFDKLPLLIIDRFNYLLSDIISGDLASSLTVNSYNGTTLTQFVESVQSTLDSNFAVAIADIQERLDRLEEKVGE